MDFAAGDIHHRSLIEQDTAIDLINPGFKQKYQDVEKQRPKKANLKERLKEEIIDKEKSHLEVIKEAKKQGTGKLEPREGRKKAFQSSFVLSDGSNLKCPTKEENMKNYRIPRAK